MQRVFNSLVFCVTFMCKCFSQRQEHPEVKNHLHKYLISLILTVQQIFQTQTPKLNEEGRKESLEHFKLQLT